MLSDFVFVLSKMIGERTDYNKNQPLDCVQRREMMFRVRFTRATNLSDDGYFSAASTLYAYVCIKNMPCAFFSSSVLSKILVQMNSNECRRTKKKTTSKERDSTQNSDRTMKRIENDSIRMERASSNNADTNDGVKRSSAFVIKKKSLAFFHFILFHFVERLSFALFV